MMCGDRWLETGSPWEGDEMTEREQFEKWISTRKLCTKYGAKLDRLTDGHYRDVRVRGHFVTWQAARATPALPQGERKCSECGNGEPDLSLYCVRCLNNDGWHQVPKGMAIVPVDCITTVARDVEYSPHTSRHTPFLRVNFAYDDYDSRDRVYAMLAATKETTK